ncbi:hypothetical protein FRACYDRAFT_235533 [Fragilariopsis cylindrus CCMP1102]|uniref:Uncharacterized protein n=1 Tax=Fragilariopsis cylindrus CCMP1102 TaxID=635003 RepID=A0A1E7FMW2_9STRA|nr:hypothetical protein FRACYDRAFT_235533 [Fragilariopsis cylindrus CCMP1102]|eukprot:OEU19476.1 hypothetical protein FRACYDRAFT_235533 [Fragilariopsis cylindrus CCMP1102]
MASNTTSSLSSLTQIKNKQKQSSSSKQSKQSKSILHFVIPIAILFCFICNNFALLSKYDFNLQCNISGTYVLQQHGNGQQFQYHYYASSDDYRNRDRETETDYIDKETIATPGILYAVGGTEEFLITAFVPVIDYLRNGLDIPNSIERQQQRDFSTNSNQQQHQTQLKQQQQRWAIATEPHLCNSKIFQKSIRTFFDVIIIITKDQLQKEYTNNTNEISWDPYTDNTTDTDDEDEDDDEDEPTANTSTPTSNFLQNNTHDNGRNRIRIRNRNMRRKLLSYDVVGTGSKIERRDTKLRHHVKAIKVIGLNEAPFVPYTMFIDVDMIPCITNFASTLLNKTLLTLFNNNNRQQQQHQQQHQQNQDYFDIALTSERKPKKNKQSKGKEYDNMYDIEHYYLNNNKIDYKQDNGSGYGYNLHNSACLILNMTSHKTIELLQRYKILFFNIPSSEPVLPNTRDQPSLGKAMYDMMMMIVMHSIDSNNSNTNSTTINNSHNHNADLQMLKHIDMNYVCRSKLTGKKNNNCDRSRAHINEDGEKEKKEEEEEYCLLAHKIKKLPTT